MKCTNCDGDGYTVEADCCGQFENGLCCNIPVPVQVQCDACRATGQVDTKKLVDVDPAKIRTINEGT